MTALSSEALARIDEVEPQCIAVLTELQLPRIEPLEAKLDEVVDFFIRNLPSSTAAWHSGGYPECLAQLMADHLGARGVARIFAAIGLVAPEAPWLERAAARFPYSGLGDVSRSRRERDFEKPTPRRVYGYAEWELSVPHCKVVVHGARLRENGYIGRPLPNWLRASQLPNNPHIDHKNCSEFQLLSEAIEQVIAGGLASSLVEAAAVRGVLRLLISTTPCLSCTCAFQQFRLLFPLVRVEFAQLRPWDVPGTYGGAPQEQVEAEAARRGGGER